MAALLEVTSLPRTCRFDLSLCLVAVCLQSLKAALISPFPGFPFRRLAQTDQTKGLLNTKVRQQILHHKLGSTPLITLSTDGVQRAWFGRRIATLVKDTMSDLKLDNQSMAEKIGSEVGK